MAFFGKNFARAGAREATAVEESKTGNVLNITRSILHQGGLFYRSFHPDT